MRLHSYFVFLLLPCSLFSQKSAVDALVDKGWSQHYTNLDSAIMILDKALIDAQRLNYEPGIANAQSRIAVCYDLKGETETALTFYLDAIKNQKSRDDLKGLSFSYSNLGLMYLYQDEFNESRNYLNRSLDIDRQIGDTTGMGMAYSNLAVCYMYLDSIGKSLDCIQTAIDLSEVSRDTATMLSAMSTKARILYNVGQSEASLEIYDEIGIKLQGGTFSNEMIISNYIGRAELNMELENYVLAEEQLKKALALSHESGNREREQWCYESLQQVAIKQDKFEEAHNYLTRYTELRDSLVNEERINSLNEIQTKYNVAEKDILIAAQERKNLLLTVGLILAVLITFFAWFAYRSKKRIGLLLEERNRSISQNLKQKETMLGEIHHRVKNNLQLVSSILYLKSRSLKNEEAKTALLDSRHKVNSMAGLHKYLYQQYDTDRVDLKGYISQLVSGASSSLEKENQSVFYNLDLEEDIHVSPDTAINIGVVLSELITNIYKYAFEPNKDGEFRIKTERTTDNLLRLIIQDYGKGTASNKETLVDASFGLEMVNSLVEQLNGSWEIDGKGGMAHKIELQLNE